MANDDPMTIIMRLLSTKKNNKSQSSFNVGSNYFHYSQTTSKLSPSATSPTQTSKDLKNGLAGHKGVFFFSEVVVLEGQFKLMSTL